jgi:hypothetical protein
MVVFRFASLGIVLLFLGCASNPKPIEVDMPVAQKHFIVKGPDDPTTLR